MRSVQATHNQFAVSANTKETAINTEQTLDTQMLCALSDVMNLEPRREDNSNEAIGLEEPDTVYDNGALAGMTMNFEKAQPQHFAFLLAYALGQVSTAVKGDGYQHTITPISGDLDESRSNPSFTLAQRYGKTVVKRRYASCFVDSVTFSFIRDAWVKLSGVIKATGKFTNNIESETVSAAGDATTITLASNGVHGATAAERLANVQHVYVELSAGVKTEVTVTAVSDASPAVLTIVDPGGTSSPAVDYEVLYIPDESGWMTFPARISETPLRVSEVSAIFGGKWTGSAFSGGRTIAAEVKSVEGTFNNNGECQFTLGAGGDYASRYVRNGRTQKVKLDREFREFIMQQHIEDNDTFGLYIKAEGSLYDETYKYQVEIIYPKCAVMTSPISVDNKRLGESVDVQVLEDATYGSIIVKVQNLQATYAA
jgi:hypothetical protein